MRPRVPGRNHFLRRFNRILLCRRIDCRRFARIGSRCRRVRRLGDGRIGIARSTASDQRQSKAARHQQGKQSFHRVVHSGIRIRLQAACDDRTALSVTANVTDAAPAQRADVESTRLPTVTDSAFGNSDQSRIRQATDEAKPHFHCP